MRSWIKVSAAALISLCAGIASAQKFPERPITLICPFTPGAAADVQLRALAEAISTQLEQTVVVDTGPGAAGTLGASVLANSKPDGYTLAQVTNTIIRQPFIAK